MKKISLSILLFFVLTFQAFAAVELDTDGNKAIDVNLGGTNAKTAGEALSNLGGQPYDADLDILSSGSFSQKRALIEAFAKPVLGVDALRTTMADFDGDCRYLAYHTASGDGGHGTFCWDAASTDADDDQDTIAVTGVSTGRWKRNIDQVPLDIDELPTPSTVVKRDSGGRGAFAPAVAGSHAVILNQLADLILDRLFENIDYWLDDRVTGDLVAGWFKLPLGIKVQFGKVLTSATDSTWVTYDYPTPFRTFLGVIVGNGMDPYGGDVRVRTSGLSQFQVWSSGYLNRYVQWIAVGLDKPYQINSAEMGLDGVTLTLTMSREGVIGDDYAEDRWTLTGSVSGSQHPVSHVLANGTPDTITLTFETPYVAGETLTLSYIYGKNQVYALDDSEPLRGFPEMDVTNNSITNLYTWPFDDNTSSSAIVCTENSAYNMALWTQAGMVYVNTADAWDSVRGGINMKGTGESTGREARTWLGDVGLGVGATLWAVELEFTLNEAVPSGVTPHLIGVLFSDSDYGLSLYYYPLTGQYRLLGGYVNEYATSTYTLVVGTTYKLTLNRPAGGTTLVVSLIAGGATVFEHTFAVTDTGTDIGGMNVGSASTNAYLPATVTNLKVTSTGD